MGSHRTNGGIHDLAGVDWEPGRWNRFLANGYCASYFGRNAVSARSQNAFRAGSLQERPRRWVAEAVVAVEEVGGEGVALDQDPGRGRDPVEAVAEGAVGVEAEEEEVSAWKRSSAWKNARSSGTRAL